MHTMMPTLRAPLIEGFGGPRSTGLISPTSKPHFPRPVFNSTKTSASTTESAEAEADASYTSVCYAGGSVAERLANAKTAFARGDKTGSADIHRRFANNSGADFSHPEKTLDEGEFVRPAVFGGLDGASTSFSLLAGAIGVKLGWSHLIGISLAQVFAGAFAMGFGEYVSARAERQIALRELNREKWEVENFPEGEIAEMVDIYIKNGLSIEDAQTVAFTLSKYPKFWCEHMLLHEIGILPPGEKDTAWRSALAMFLAFLIAGALPVLSYIFVGIVFCGEGIPGSGDATEVTDGVGMGLHPSGSLVTGASETSGSISRMQSIDDACLARYGFDIAIIVTLSTLFALGYMKNKIAETNGWLGGTVMAFQGALAGVISYVIGVQVGGGSA